MTDAIEIIKKFSGLSEVAEIREFRGYKDGREAVVRLYDRGPDGGSLRYSAETFYLEPEDLVITEARENFSHGNPAGDLQTALMHVHWNVL